MRNEAATAPTSEVFGLTPGYVTIELSFDLGAAYTVQSATGTANYSLLQARREAGVDNPPKLCSLKRGTEQLCELSCFG